MANTLGPSTEFDGKVVLVTGAGSGIGAGSRFRAAIALRSRGITGLDASLVAEAGIAVFRVGFGIWLLNPSSAASAKS